MVKGLKLEGTPKEVFRALESFLAGREEEFSGWRTTNGGVHSQCKSSDKKVVVNFYTTTGSVHFNGQIGQECQRDFLSFINREAGEDVTGRLLFAVTHNWSKEPIGNKKQAKSQKEEPVGSKGKPIGSKEKPVGSKKEPVGNKKQAKLGKKEQVKLMSKVEGTGQSLLTTMMVVVVLVVVAYWFN